MRSWILISVLVAAAGTQASPPAPAQFADPNRRAKLATAFAEIDRSFAEFAKTSHVPGAAWGIVIDGELAHSGAAGVREISSNAPVDADTVFRIASMTKSFTAMAVLKLRDEGRLSLDDPAERYVPELKNLRYPTTDSPRITIRHLLTHSEGFPEDNPWGDQQLSESEEPFRGCFGRAFHSRMHPVWRTSTPTMGSPSSDASCRRRLDSRTTNTCRRTSSGPSA
jgi:CubicO group peptidase (beta-lactamase class C family)